VIRLIRLELRYQGRQQEIILEAKTDGLQSEKLAGGDGRSCGMGGWSVGGSNCLVERLITAALPGHQVTGFSRASLPGQGNFNVQQQLSGNDGECRPKRMKPSLEEDGS
jgi:hypothetical protein